MTALMGLETTSDVERRLRPVRDRVAVITGASSGIGEATARRLATAGARVALLGRRAERLNAIAEEISKRGDEAIALPTAANRGRASRRPGALHRAGHDCDGAAVARHRPQ